MGKSKGKRRNQKAKVEKQKSKIGKNIYFTLPFLVVSQESFDG